MQTTVTPLREPDLERSPQPPANIEAEQALLGAILINNAAHGRVAEFLLPEHFANAVHGRIYAAISTIRRSSRSSAPSRNYLSWQRRAKRKAGRSLSRAR